jgi:voltage-gated potassium channel
MTAKSANPSHGLFHDLIQRLILPVFLLVGVTTGGTIGYWIIGKGRWGLLDALYMTSITLTTVGYGEVLEGMGSGARVFTIVLMWTGMGVALYSVSAVTAFVVERRLGEYIRERRMVRELSQLQQHTIVCGAGKTGENIVREFIAVKRPFCVVEIDSARAEELREFFPDILTVKGDATDETVLQRAGIERASGIIANLPDDSKNLLIAVTARYVRPDIRIVVRAQDQSIVPKLKRAGADYVVNPGLIGGLRMASEVLRPHVVTFLDRMLRGTDPTIRVDEVIIGDSCPLQGQTLEEAKVLHRTGLNPIALRLPGNSEFQYNLPPGTRLEAGSVLIVIGNPEQLAQLRALCDCSKSGN